MEENKSILGNLFDRLIYSVSSNSLDQDKKLDNLIDSIVSSDSGQKYEKRFYDLITSVIKLDEKEGKQSDLQKLLTNPEVDPSKELSTKNQQYNFIESIKEQIPYCKKTLKILVSSIVSPDNITKKSILVTSDKITIEDDDRLIDLTHDILTHFEVDDKLPKWISNALSYGTGFIEIVNINDVLHKFGFLKESVLLENEITDLYNKKDTLNFDYPTFLSENVNKLSFEINEKNINDVDLLWGNGNIEINLLNFEQLNETIKNKFKRDVTIILEDNTDEDKAIFTNKKQLNFNDMYLKFHDIRSVIKLGDENFTYGYIVVEGDLTEMYKNKSIPIAGTSGIVSNTLDDKNKRMINEIIDKIKTKVDSKFLNQEKDLRQILAQTVTYFGINNDNQKKSINIRYVVPGGMQEFNNTNNESIFDGVKLDAKLYLAQKVMMTLNRLNNSIERREINVELGMDRDASKFINAIKEKLRKNKYTIDKLGNIDTIQTVISSFEDYVVPMKNGKKFFEINNVPPRTEGTNVVNELKMLRDSIIANMDVPPAFLNIEENIDSKATLSQENIMFAITILHYQKIFSKHLTELIKKILILMGENPRYINVSLNPPIMLKSEREILYFQNLGTILEIYQTLNIPLEIFMEEYIYPFIPKEEIENKRILDKLEKASDVIIKGGKLADISSQEQPQQDMYGGLPPIPGATGEEDMGITFDQNGNPVAAEGQTQIEGQPPVEGQSPEQAPEEGAIPGLPNV